MNRGVFITVATCLGFIALILALFLSRLYTPRELTLDEYKLLGAYFIDPPRQLAETDQKPTAAFRRSLFPLKAPGSFGLFQYQRPEANPTNRTRFVSDGRGMRRWGFQ